MNGAHATTATPRCGKPQAATLRGAVLVSICRRKAEGEGTRWNRRRRFAKCDKPRQSDAPRSSSFRRCGCLRSASLIWPVYRLSRTPSAEFSAHGRPRKVSFARRGECLAELLAGGGDEGAIVSIVAFRAVLCRGKVKSHRSSPCEPFFPRGRDVAAIDRRQDRRNPRAARADPRFARIPFRAAITIRSDVL